MRKGIKNHNTGLSKHPLYATYFSMHDRCRNPNAKPFKNYGGRGIRVCERWSGDGGFKNFLADMGEKPSPCHSLDRIDNDGNYEPLNCRWATRLEQVNNRRGVVRYNYKGELLTQTELARKLNIDLKVFHFRLKRWSFEKAITKPVRKSPVRTRA